MSVGPFLPANVWNRYAGRTVLCLDALTAIPERTPATSFIYGGRRRGAWPVSTD